jgi:hypothetical protein
MKILILTLLTSLNTWSVPQNYRADVFDLNFKAENPDFKFELTEQKNENTLKITGVFKKDNDIKMLEEAVIDESSADIISYKIEQKQTGESGFIEIKDKKIKIKFTANDKSEKTVELDLPNRLVAPANFDRWLQKNFSTIKEKKSLVFDFLVWDKLDTYKFKIKYLGEVDLSGKKAHQFKMNIDNIFLSAIVDPIIIWYNLDMTDIQQYQGRVAVKLGERPNLKNLDAVVKYFH